MLDTILHMILTILGGLGEWKRYGKVYGKDANSGLNTYPELFVEFKWNTKDGVHFQGKVVTARLSAN